LVVGLTLGPAAVAIFSPIRTLSRFVIQSTAVITRLIEPEMALAFGGGNHDLFRSIFSRSCQVALWAGMGSCIVLGAAGEKVLCFWTRGEVAMNWPLFILLLLTAAANCLWFTALMVPYATNRHTSIAWFYACVYGGAAFVVAYFGARMAGLAGVGAALLLAEIALAAHVLPAALRLSGVTWRSWLWTLGRPPWFLLQGLRWTRN